MRRRWWRYCSIGAWMLFTISLSVWWLYFGISQLRILEGLDIAEAPKLVQYQRMLLWEGVSLVVAVLLGGGALFYFGYREAKERERIASFFSIFTHELKTPLTSLQLQAEQLRGKLTEEGAIAKAHRLVESSHRLQLQLENAIVIAQDTMTLVSEGIELKSFFLSSAQGWPGVAVSIEGNARVLVDRRALETVLQNLFANAVLHGEASEILISIHDVGKANQVEVRFRDSGNGFQGDRSSLGKRFHRHYEGSGSGVGLSVVASLLRRLECDIAFPPTDQGFLVVFTLPKA